MTEAELQRVIAEKGHYGADEPIATYAEKFISGWIIRYWTQIVNIINTNRRASN